MKASVGPEAAAVNAETAGNGGNEGQLVSSGGAQGDALLSWLEAITPAGRSIRGVRFLEERDHPVTVPSKAVLDALTAEVRKQIDRHIKRARIYALRRARGKGLRKPPLLVLRLPTGFGKTEALLILLRRALGRYPTWPVVLPDGRVREEERIPFGFLALSHRLVGEVKERFAKPAADGETLPEIFVDTLEGRERLCRRAEEMRLLTQAGVKTDKMCHQIALDAVGKSTEVMCPFAGVCGYAPMLRRLNEDPEGRGVWHGSRLETCKVLDDAMAADAALIAQGRKNHVPDVLMMPHAFGTQPNLPLNARHLRMFVWDESALNAALGHTAFPISVLESPDRKRPNLSDRERNEDVDSAAMLERYKDLCRAMAVALKAGEDAAEAFARHALRARDVVFGDLADDDWSRITDLLQVARRIATGAGRGDIVIDADLTRTPNLERVRTLVAQPREKWGREEHRFWSIIQDRLALIREHGLEALPRRTERRIGYDEPEKMVEVSWRNEVIWDDVPGIVLDACAQEDLYRAVFGDRFDVRFPRPIEVEPRLRTIYVAGYGMSTSSLRPAAQSRPYDEKIRNAKGEVVGSRERDPHDEAARRRLTLNRVIAGIGMAHGPGAPILLGATKAIEADLAEAAIGGTASLAALDRGLADPFAGIDAGLRAGHYGAFAGLDYAKDYAAAVSIGKLELPEAVIRRLGRAVDYDQPEDASHDLPPADGDKPGDPQTTVERVLRMRDGRLVAVKHRVYRDRWQRLLQAQRREEQTVQFAGRLRPIHKTHLGDTPNAWQTLWIVSNVIPEATVIDAVVHADDIANQMTLIEVASRFGGCVTPDAWLAAGMCDTKHSGDKARESASRQLLNLGLSAKTAPPPGMSVVKVRPQGRGAAAVVWVVDALVDDPVQAALDHLASFGRANGAATLVASAQRSTAARDPGIADTRVSRAERLATIEAARAVVAKRSPGLKGEDLAVAVERVRFEMAVERRDESKREAEEERLATHRAEQAAVRQALQQQAFQAEQAVPVDTGAAEAVVLPREAMADRVVDDQRPAALEGVVPEGGSGIAHQPAAVARVPWRGEGAGAAAAAEAAEVVNTAEEGNLRRAA